MHGSITSTKAEVGLTTPYKGRLVDLITSPHEAGELFSYAARLPSIQLSRREACDLEMLAIGAFSPLDRFLGEKDYNAVLDNMRLADKTVFPIPITLATDDRCQVKIGCDIALRDAKNDILAVMTVEEIYEWDRERFATSVLGTRDVRHPLVAESRRWGEYNLSGELRVLKLPKHHDFCDLRLTPRQTREHLENLGRSTVVAFQTRNPLHRAHEAMIERAIDMTGGTLLLHPAVGMTKDGDIDHYTRVRTYKAITESSRADRILLSLLPLAMRMAGPREAVWHAIIRRNYGANFMIVGRDHASPGRDSNGKPFYDAAAAQRLARELSTEIGVEILAFDEFAYLPDERRYEEIDKIAPGSRVFSLSGTRLREDFLEKGKQPPDWFIRPEVAKILAASYVSHTQQGVCLWFTGLSGSGKSTTAEIVAALLLEEGRRSTLLDGDVVRTNLSKRLGFSREDRDINIARIGFVASEIVRHGGVAICAAISPYSESRAKVRQMFGDAQFIEIFVDTPLEVCEMRDTKGLYAKARRGEVTNFTGIDDIYDTPEQPEITLDTVHQTAADNARLIIDHLRSKGYIDAACAPVTAH